MKCHNHIIIGSVFSRELVLVSAVEKSFVPWFNLVQVQGWRFLGVWSFDNEILFAAEYCLVLVVSQARFLSLM